MPLPIKKKNRNRPRKPISSSRLLESNGPDVKIKGSASQIVEKYLTLSRESNTSGDRVSAESYMQYAEHYQRIVEATGIRMQQTKNQTRETKETELSKDDTAKEIATNNINGSTVSKTPLEGQPVSEAISSQNMED